MHARNVVGTVISQVPVPMKNLYPTCISTRVYERVLRIAGINFSYLCKGRLCVVRLCDKGACTCDNKAVVCV